jgi:hypothetical protein
VKRFYKVRFVLKIVPKYKKQYKDKPPKGLRSNETVE